MEAPDKSIFIGNLSEEMCESTVAEYCSTYGALSKCRLMTDPVTKSMRRFGFISFRNPHSTYKFLTNIPHYICGRQVAVKPIKKVCKICCLKFYIELNKNHRLTDDVLITNKKRLLACCISNSAIAEATVFEYLTSFGAIKQVIHHHQSGNKGIVKMRLQLKGVLGTPCKTTVCKQCCDRVPRDGHLAIDISLWALSGEACRPPWALRNKETLQKF